MARRKSGGSGVILLIIVFIAIGGITTLIEKVGLHTIIAALVAIVVLAWYLVSRAKKKRRLYLQEKYGDEQIVQQIIDKNFWQGQTAEQLLDALGSPETVDNKVLKTKKKEIWKYQRQGHNRYGLKITVENDVVVGWDQKA